jgi:hypothetical protein
MGYDVSRCADPREHRQMFRRKNGTWKTRQWRRALAKFDRCIAGAIEKSSDVIDSGGDAAADLADSILGGGGTRPAYVPDYDQGGPSGGEQFFSGDVGGIPMPLALGAGAIVLFLAMRK